jgi:hypothetical protein
MFRGKCNRSLIAQMFLFMPREKFCSTSVTLKMKEGEPVHLISKYYLNFDETEMCGKGDEALSC